jgi:hypothetical protein
LLLPCFGLLNPYVYQQTLLPSQPQ